MDPSGLSGVPVAQGPILTTLATTVQPADPSSSMFVWYPNLGAPGWRLVQKGVQALHPLTLAPVFAAVGSEPGAILFSESNRHRRTPRRCSVRPCDVPFLGKHKDRGRFGNVFATI